MKLTLTQKIPFHLILFSILIFSCSQKKKEDSTVAILALIGNNSRTTTTATTATIPSQLTYVSSNEESGTGNYIVLLGNLITITNTTPFVTGASVVYSVNPSLPSGLAIDASTGHIVGTATVSQNLTSYVVTATYTAQSGYRLNTTTGLTRTIKIHIVSIATIPTQLTYTSISSASSSGNFIVTLGNSLTITNTTASVTGGNVVYSVNPSLSNGLTFDTSTGHIAGIPTANQSLTSYVVTATYTAQSGYKLNTTTGLTRTIKIFIGSSTTISNLTCNATGTNTAIGCTASFPYSCTSSSLCYASQASCYNSSECIQ